MGYIDGASANNENDFLEAIERLSRNKIFQNIKRELSGFNIFEATQMKSQEIKHTQFLAYLLDPNETHNFGDKFLLEFIRGIPACMENKVKQIDCNFSLARISPEKVFTKNSESSFDSNRGKRDQIDLIIEIPSLSNPEKNYLIVIENKIKSSLSENQLKKYENAVKRKYYTDNDEKNWPIITYLFLNTQYEEPDSAAWISIQYSETVIPAIEILLNDYRDAMSDYMASILSDYIRILSPFNDSNAEGHISLADSDFFKDVDFVNKSISGGELKSFLDRNIEYKSFLCRYSSVLDYVSGYDADPRKKIYDYFIRESFFADTENKNNLIFNKEDSSRRFLRFSLLTKDSADFISTKSSGARKWLSSGRHLAFEIVLSCDDGLNIKLRTCFILGPTNEDLINRADLFSRIKSAWKNQELLKENPTEFWSVIDKSDKAYKTISVPHKENRPDIDSANKAVRDIIKKIINDGERLGRVMRAMVDD